MIGFIKHAWSYDRIVVWLVTGVVAMIVLVIWVVIAAESARQQRIVDCLAEARDRYAALEQTGETGLSRTTTVWMMIAYETARNGCYIANKAPESSTTVVVR